MTPTLTPQTNLKLNVNLGTICSNYRAIKAHMGSKEAGVVIKANAYGMGAIEVGNAVYAEGCRKFFVATLNEAMELRQHLPDDAKIYNLNGFFVRDAPLYLAYRVIPVLGDKKQLIEWIQKFKESAVYPEAALQFDTGMGRLGLFPSEAEEVQKTIEGFPIQLIISHLANAHIVTSAFNEEQRQKFEEIQKFFPNYTHSLSASNGVFLGENFHFHLARIGMGLYGAKDPGDPLNKAENHKFALKLSSRILHVKKLNKGQTVGYSQTYKAPDERCIATISMGFADGLPRNMSNVGHVLISGYKAPIVGRISMDLTTIDVTDIPETIAAVGNWVDVFNDHMSLYTMCDDLNTTAYEFLSRLGNRVKRIYG